MKRVLVGAAAFVLAASSYASAAPPEGVAGAPMPTSGRADAAPAPTAPALGHDGLDIASLRRAARYGRTLEGLQPEGRAAVRGAKEVRVYQAAAPSVVLVLADEGFGSGALVSADGQIITNLHVVGDADEVGVVFKPKTEGDKFTEADVRVAKVIRRDEVADLALIQVSETPEGVTPLLVGDVASVQVGSDVHAIGHPTGNSWTYTRGIVSQIRKDQKWTIEDGTPHTATVVQTQTPINPGNSGGPLLDDDLRIVGVNSFASEGEGLNFAVSGDDVKAFLARTADRRVEPSLKARAAAAKACETKELDRSPSKDPVGIDYLLDTDCDDVGDLLVNIPEDESEAIAYVGDANGDDEIDFVVLDDDRDGQFDRSYYDTDADGEFDLEGFFKPGATTPYRYEVMEPKDR